MTAGLPARTLNDLPVAHYAQGSVLAAPLCNKHSRTCSAVPCVPMKSLDNMLRVSLSDDRAPTRDALATSQGYAGHIQAFRERSHVPLNFTLIYSCPETIRVGAFGRNLLIRKNK